MSRARAQFVFKQISRHAYQSVVDEIDDDPEGAKELYGLTAPELAELYALLVDGDDND